MIGFELSEEQLALQARAREFALAELVPRRAELDEHNRFPEELHARAFEQGFLRLSLPREVGGEGRPYLDTLLAVEEIAYGDLGFATSHFVQWLSIGALLGHGTPEQQSRWLGALTRRPSFCSFALTEPHAGSAGVQLARTVARPVDGGYELSGEKCYITNAPVADWFTVLARVEPSPLPPGEFPLTCFVVPRESAGLSVRAPYHKLGQRASATGEVTLDRVFVEAGNLIGEVGAGPRIVLSALNRGRSGIGAMGTGVARAARDLVLNFGYARRTFGNQRLIAQQDYRFRLADIDVRIHAARMLTWRAAWEIDNGPAPERFASMAKLFGGDLAASVTGEAVEMLGGLGYMREGAVEKLMRDAKLLQIYEGPPAVQKTLLAEYATKRPPWFSRL